MPDKETFIDRIKLYLAKKNISVWQLEQDSKLKKGVLNNAIRANATIGSDKLALILSNNPDLNPLWLLMGDGPMIKPKGGILPIDGEKVVLPISLSMKETSIVEMKAMAGGPVMQFLDGLQQEAKLLPHLSFRAQFFIRISGDSMESTLKDGDCVVVSQCFPDEVVDNKIYVVHTTDGEVFIKRVVVDAAKKVYMFISDNIRKYRPFSKEEHEIFAIFRVLGTFQPLEE